MGIFAMRARRPPDNPEAREELSEAQRQALPPHLEAVGEALASGWGVEAPCEVAGRLLARQGASLEEALEALARTARVVTGGDPDHAAVRALAIAWSDATLAYLHRLSCDDPLTGLSSMPHLRGRIADLYRGEGAPARDSHALVLVEASSLRATTLAKDDGSRSRSDELAGTLLLGQLGARARTVFGGSETISRVGHARIAVLAGRERLGSRVAVLARMLEEVGPPVRVWIEGLPGSDSAAAGLLDELARS